MTVPLGNLTPEQFRGLGQIMRKFSGGNARTQQNQNLVLRWVHDASLARAPRRPAGDRPW